MERYSVYSQSRQLNFGFQWYYPIPNKRVFLKNTSSQNLDAWPNHFIPAYLCFLSKNITVDGGKVAVFNSRQGSYIVFENMEDLRKHFKFKSI